MKILAIGNSFSEDALAYLHDMAAADGRAVECVNLSIGGCSLQRHCENIDRDAPDYSYQKNGTDTGRKTSIREALREPWDCITIQQASHDSGIPETYTPYLEKLLSYIRGNSKDTPIYFHQTWAYEIDSPHEAFTRYHRNQMEMYDALSVISDQIHRKFLLPIIPSGEVIQALRQLPPFDYANGGSSLCKDGYHMEPIYGRYAVAAVWYRMLQRADLRENTFVSSEAAEAGILERIRELVMDKVCPKML